MNEQTKELTAIDDDQELFGSYLELRRPVLISGAAFRMEAFRRWTDDYIVEKLKGLRATVRFEDGQLAAIPIELFFNYLRNPDQFNSSRGKLYLTDLYVQPSFNDDRRRSLAGDSAFPLCRKGSFAEWISVYAGPTGTHTPCHQDIFSTHTWLAQLRGQKIWQIWEPDGGGQPPDERRIPPTYEITTKPGDLIYLPPDWWHEVHNLSTTLAISGNFCSFEEARRALIASQSSDSPEKDNWIRTWEQILCEQVGS